MILKIINVQWRLTPGRDIFLFIKLNVIKWFIFHKKEYGIKKLDLHFISIETLEPRENN